MKKAFKYSVITIMLLSLTVFIVYNMIPVTAQASWADSQKNIEEAFNNSDIVLIANVTSSNSYKLHESVFTNYNIDITNAFKGSEKVTSDNIQIRLKGGNLGLKEYRVEGQKMLEINKPYLFLLKKVWPNDSNSQEYAPIGGYQGVIALSDTNGRFREKNFNDSNRLEKELKDKDIISTLDGLSKE